MKGKGTIVMTDTDKKNKKLAFDYFKRAGLQSQFEFRVGDALKIVKRYDSDFDILLNDINKQDYPATIDIAAAKLKKGGLFITDNVIWSGQVAERKQDKTTKKIVEFTEKLYQDSRFFTTVLPLRDGIGLSIKL
jgi:predicted O-methyltransferase YrrM